LNTYGILLAAGASSRMRGVDKLTKELRGRPLLRDRALMLTQSQLTRIIVVIPAGHYQRRQTLAGLDLDIVENPDPASGMASSIKAGIAALPTHTEAALIMPADMPDIEAGDIDALCTIQAQAPTHILRACAAETPGSPVIFPRAYFDALLQLEGDASGRTVLKTAEHVAHHTLDGERATCDLDTPEAWAAWQARNS